MAKTYDPACYELAEHFLKDEPFGNPDGASYEQACHDLALTIQQAVEDWFPKSIASEDKGQRVGGDAVSEKRDEICRTIDKAHLHEVLVGFDMAVETMSGAKTEQSR